MEHRKNLNKDLRRQSGLFFQIGLLIALMICVSAFEYTTKTTENPIDPRANIIEPEWTPPVTDIPPPKPPKPKIANPVEVEDEPLEEPPEELTFDMKELGEIDIPIKIEDEQPDEHVEETFLVVEEMPTPKDGYEGFYQFIKKNLKYPSQARRMDIEGKVYVKFVVTEDGSLDQIHILKGIGAGCDEEVLRVMDKAPKWNPGKQRGRAVKVWRTLPINFNLN